MDDSRVAPASSSPPTRYKRRSSHAQTPTPPPAPQPQPPQIVRPQPHRPALPPQPASSTTSSSGAPAPTATTATTTNIPSAHPPTALNEKQSRFGASSSFGSVLVHRIFAILGLVLQLAIFAALVWVGMRLEKIFKALVDDESGMAVVSWGGGVPTVGLEKGARVTAIAA